MRDRYGDFKDGIGFGFGFGFGMGWVWVWGCLGSLSKVYCFYSIRKRRRTYVVMNLSG